MQEETSIWRQVIVEKYGVQRGGWCSKEARGPYEVCLWRNIRNGWGNFSNFVSFKDGDGSYISFWHDIWCIEAALKSAFPLLYSIARSKESLVSNYLDSYCT
jgi:hypothetical protein